MGLAQFCWAVLGSGGLWAWLGCAGLWWVVDLAELCWALMGCVFGWAVLGSTGLCSAGLCMGFDGLWAVPELCPNCAELRSA